MSKEKNLEEYLCVIGEKIAATRHLHAEKITTVARAVGLSHSVISQIENGRYYCLKIDTLIKIGTYLQIPLEELLPYLYYIINPESIKNEKK
ncbi:MAG: helix-turn-helix domain-containing protein [Chitinophagales bacterium]